MNDTALKDFLTPIGDGSSWAAKCVRRLLEAENLTEIAEGLVAQNGQKPVERIKDVWNAWGIDMETCHAYCARQNFPMQVFDFPIFTSGVTNYLLPWLGLTAQLPYETGSISGNFESFCLAVGSPMLSTFSLMSTALNAHSTSITFTAKFGNGKTTSHLREAVDSAEYFLCNSQQSPIRIKEDQFRQLFDEDTERLRDRWLPLEERIRKTRRQYTFSLIAQTFFAVIAWVLTIVGSYVTSLGQHSEALLLSSGTLWTWLVPVVLGWMAAGTQSRKDTVREAIQGEILSGASAPIKALEAESGFINPPMRQLPQALWSKVQGDEACQGPAYNYARILTYPKLRDRIVDEFERRRSFPEAQAAQADHSEPVQQVQRNNTTQLEAGSSQNVDEPYMTWKDVKESSDWKWNFIISNAIAVFLQWGVTGSAIVISYLTEVRGLGCRSGSYLLYGILATCAHVLLLISVFLSHHVMLIYQTERRNGATGAVQEVPRSPQIKWIGRLAVLMRLFGKSIAIINATWIILSSVFELIGFYESCWCTGTVLGLGNRAWVVLFVSGDKMRDDAEASWIGGLAMSLFTMIFTYILTKSYSQSKL
ncbi:hypothetical protein COCC4DRAFT_199117 [Bipolaris maydis ATCC 48331]|uniref:Uncharacterized protein n=2 Tax=Cochliobolus heterostrophus TaxID=5016 RepID=M2TGZ8_COCH5|nr:uncharacterized protein COCC4DRAFT_199117 [Bipolaris maydis ATCC 48331]EMD96720.1 hypothetical protein COCHEDRAFT_1162701 [Bipolaris maydis C5]KAJ5020852.1 hypothetical protein J3E73DRAFT_242256 [Bipolaris maydis]ENI03588.1 hypothetical protein COCC4DRAFT_199117 [Bipolaris maydis ATCC 48331]KAJ5031395.1 hypothetical protein J3E73DRAFT_428553 [Bipolaris maydis]KAJ6211365.1 hypothetical protein PSV09DRAFT_1162701 [Bipolaris maydis]